MKNVPFTFVPCSCIQKLGIAFVPKIAVSIIFIFVFLGFNSTPLTSQNSEICGNYIRPEPPSLQEVREKVYIDRFGNYYLQSELSSWNVSQSLVDCSNNVFNLSFNDGFTIEQEETICEVFNYLSQLMGNPTVAIPAEIWVLRQSLPGPTGATGSPSWDATCGLTNSTILEKISGGGLDAPSGFPDGIIRVDSDIPDSDWHTISQDNGPNDPNVAITELDLYSVVLHEALHVLGFASRITADGMPLDIFDNSGNLILDTDAYSKWDSYIYSKINNQYLIELMTEPILCCDQRIFNSDDFPNMPDPVDGDCSNGIIFNGGSVAPHVNNLTDLGSANPDQLDFLVLNKLSHLYKEDLVCNPTEENYVMHSNIEYGPDWVNRIISDTELSIMCDLGYPIENLCDDQCEVIAHNDFFIRYIENLSFIDVGEIIANDINAEYYSISFDFECGNLPPDSYSFSPGCCIYTDIEPPPGLYFFCYTINGCNGECDDGIVYLNHGVSECDNECDLFCHGSFEEFIPTPVDNYFTQLSLDPFIFQSSLGNSPDIVYGDDVVLGNPENTFIRTGGSMETNTRESFYLPLSEPVAPGCTISVSFRATTDSPDVAIQFYASTNPPCPQPLLPDCEPSGFESCVDYIAHCMTVPPGNVNINQPDGIEVSLSPDFSSEPLIFGNPDNIVPYPYDFDLGNIIYHSDVAFTPYSFEWTNITNEPINYITVFGDLTILPPFNIQFWTAMDDIVITSDCNNQVSVSPTFPDTVCIGSTITVDYLVCHTGPGTETEDATLVVSELPLGILFGSGGDFINGESTVNDLVPNGPCETVSLELIISSNFLPGTTVSIPLDVSLQSACWMDHEISTAELNLDYCCDPPYDAGFNSEVEECTFNVSFTANELDFDHFWDFGDGATSTGATTQHTYLNIGAYTVKHIVSDICGNTYTEFQDISIIDCSNESCDCSEAEYIIDAGEGTTYTQTGLPVDLEDLTLCISGKLIIDDYITWTNIEALMFPGAEIEIIGDDAELEIYNSTIHGCDAMWQGFTAGDFGVIALENCEIRDAQFAIKALYDARIRLLDNTFNRNFVGVYTAPSSTPQFFKPESYSVDWNNNTFKCDGELLPAYGDTQLPEPGNKSYAGIWLNDVFDIFVFNEGEKNYFEGSLFGLIIDGADHVKVRSLYMKNLIEESDTYSNGNIGIKLIDCVDIRMSDLHLGNCADMQQDPCTENLRIGIEGNDAEGYVRRSGISSTEIGIMMLDAEDSGMEIGNNDLVDGNRITAEIGILFKDYINLNAGFIKIRNNTINAQKAIEINNANSIVFIESNTSLADLSVWSGNEASGLSILNSDGQITVKDNILNFINFPINDTFGNGITLSGSHHCFFERNTVNGPLTQTLANAVFVSASPNNSFCCTSVDYTATGVQFEGDCAPFNLNNTTFNNHSIGLQLTNAKIGPQYYNGNSWVGANTTQWDAVYSGPIGDLGESLFDTDPNLIPAGYSKINVLGGNATDWFTLAAGEDSKCYKDCGQELPWDSWNQPGGDLVDGQTGGDRSEEGKNVVKKGRSIQVYPNPARDVLHFQFSPSLESDSQWSVFDLTGKEVFRQDLPAGMTKYRSDQIHLPSGIYFFKIEDTNKQTLSSGKIVIAR